MQRISDLKVLHTAEIPSAVAEIITGYLPGAQILLFGSRAKKQATETSDFDLAIDNGVKIPLDIIARIKDAVEQLPTLKSIDIVDLNRVSTEFKTIVLQSGVKICVGKRFTT
ncbi:MAG: nucleotidyltransferase domain-containing protein [Desulfotomaculum sp.]|nr:nucleotidyltransferase domain-containing protein [Desulfotomaculum sp.]MCL0080655.1 nucleotidyltransferase domain-containing protein [Peptococcaceae bacterium]